MCIRVVADGLVKYGSIYKLHTVSLLSAAGQQLCRQIMGGWWVKKGKDPSACVQVFPSPFFIPTASRVGGHGGQHERSEGEGMAGR